MNGRLGAFALAATTNTTIYTGVANKTTVCTVNLCNTTVAAINVKLSLSAASTPVSGEYIEDIDIPAHGVLERSGLVIGGAQLIVARAAAIGVNAVLWGFVE